MAEGLGFDRLSVIHHFYSKLNASTVIKFMSKNLEEVANIFCEKKQKLNTLSFQFDDKVNLLSHT